MLRLAQHDIIRKFRCRTVTTKPAERPEGFYTGGASTTSEQNPSGLSSYVGLIIIRLIFLACRMAGGAGEEVCLAEIYVVVFPPHFI
jgi:hypothetical protein